jgi:hypothetical protein
MNESFLVSFQGKIRTAIVWVRYGVRMARGKATATGCAFLAVR